MFDPYDEITDLQFHAPFRVLITGSFTGGDGRVYYEAEEQILETSDGSLIDDEGGRVFTNAAGSALLCEASDADVTVPFYALARYRGDYEGTPLYDFDAGSAGVTVRELDGSPSVAAVTVLTLDQTDGLTVTDNGGGGVTVTIKDASATQNGIVTTGTQTIAGEKTLTDHLYQVDFKAHRWVAATPDLDYMVSMFGNPGNSGDLTAYWQVDLHIAGAIAGTVQAYATATRHQFLMDGPAGGATPSLAIGIQSDNATAADNCFVIGGFQGVYGTDPVGNVFQGGIVTTVGTGLGFGSLSDPGADRILFWDDSAGSLAWLEVGTGLLLSGTTLQASVGWSWDEDAQDAVGNILTDSSRINFTYSDPNPPTITADLIADTITAGYLHATAGDVLFGRDSGSGAGEEIAVGSGLTLSGATLSVSGTLPAWTKVTKHYSDFSAAATTEDIAIHSLPAGAVLHAVVIKTVVAFAGTGWIGLTLDVGKTGTLNAYISTYNAFAAVSDTNFAVPTSLAGLPRPEDFGSATSIRLKATSNGGNLNAGTAGEVDIWLWTSTLP